MCVLILYHPISLLCLIYSSIIYHICSPILVLHINTPLYYHMYIYMHAYIYIYWLVVWNIVIFPYIGKLIIPFDFHMFQRGGSTTKQYVFPCIPISHIPWSHHPRWRSLPVHRLGPRFLHHLLGVCIITVWPCRGPEVPKLIIASVCSL